MYGGIVYDIGVGLSFCAAKNTISAQYRFGISDIVDIPDPKKSGGGRRITDCP